MKLQYYASADVNGAKNLVSRAYWVSSSNLHSIGKTLVRQVRKFLKACLMSGAGASGVRPGAYSLRTPILEFWVIVPNPMHGINIHLRDI